MGFFIGLLTFALVLNCIVLILLVLMQLPKKDAGAGLAFGGGATDALFGAGSGNVLTKATKYSASIFFVLALVIGILQTRYHDRSVTALINATANSETTTIPGVMPSATPATSESVPPGSTPAQPIATNLTLETTIPPAASGPSSTNVPATE